MKTLRQVLGCLVVLGLSGAAGTLPLKLDRFLLQPVSSEVEGIPMGGGTAGYSVAVHDGRSIVGVPTGWSGSLHAGHVLVYETDPLRLVSYIPNPQPASGGNFGAAVALCGNLLAVGAPLDDTGALNSGIVFVFDLASAMPSLPLATLANPSPAAGDQFGFAVAVSDHWVLVGAPFDDASGSDAGSVYRFDLEEGPDSAVVQHPSPAAGDWFGHAVAAAGTRAAVGAPRDDAGATDSGAVFVYHLDSETPGTATATITNPEPAAGDEFGCACAMDGVRLVVGCRGDNAGAANAGCVFAFDLNGGASTRLANPSPAAGDEFGGAVAVAGSIVVAGSRFADAGASNAGKAVVFDLTASNPAVPLAVLANPEPAVEDQFGCAVAIAGDRLLVGAWLDDPGGWFNLGGARCYDLGAIAPGMPGTLLDITLPQTGAAHGGAVAVLGNRVLVGTPGFQPTGGGDEVGVVQVYDMLADVPVQPVMTLVNPDAGSEMPGNDRFGSRMAVSGNRVVVSSPGNEPEVEGEAPIGSAYLFDFVSATPETAVLRIDNPNAGVVDGFATSLAADGSRIVVGAPINDAGATDSGCAHVYDLNSATPATPVFTLTDPEPGAGDHFGASVAISGDLVAVGAPYDETIELPHDSGRVFVFDLAGTSPTEPALVIPNPDPADFGELFGTAVAVSGNRLVVSALGRRIESSPDGYEVGIAYVFDLAGATPATPIVTLEAPDAHPYDHFGEAVAIHGNRVAVGAPGDWRDGENPDEDQAWVHVFDLAGATPAVPVASLVNPRATTTWRSAAGFGAALALDAGRVVAGAPGDDTQAGNQGAASVYGIASIGIEVAGTAIPNGGSLAFGGVPAGLPIGQMLTVRNLGSAGVLVSELYLAGGEADDFAILGAPSGEIRPDRAADFRVTFTPAAAGQRGTGLRIASDDAAAPLYQVGLAGTGLSMAVDSDGDGMNDVAEYHYAPLGFDWQTPDAARVAALAAHASDAGLFTAAEIQARHGGRPLLASDPGTGGFTLRLRFLQSTDLSTFTGLPATSEAVSVDAEGAIRFEFPAPDPAAFFRIGVEPPSP